MANDYDVVIIGGTSAGRYAALDAARQKARVALVEPRFSQSFIADYAMGKINKLFHTTDDMSGFGIDKVFYRDSDDEDKAIQDTDILEEGQTSKKSYIETNIETGNVEFGFGWDLEQTIRYVNVLLDKHKEKISLSFLASQGVDVILSEGQFQSSSKGKIAFAVDSRLIRSRRYLLANDSVSDIPDIEGIEAAGFVRAEDIWHFCKQNSIPKEWLIIGGLSCSINFAQVLSSLGCKVRLVVENPSILPNLDLEVSQLLQAQLEAQGIKVLTQSRVTQVKKIDNKKWLQIGDKAFEVDEILVAAKRKPKLENLNLESVGVKIYQNRVVVNKKLQTTNKNIYACGEIIGGDNFSNIATYEAQVAIKNSLFFSVHKASYYNIPWTIFSEPNASQIGLSETQAQRKYGKSKIVILKYYFKNLTAAQAMDEINGLCKLIVLNNGEILGASILGKSAAELINLIALAMSNKVKIDSMTSFFPTEPSVSEVIQHLVDIWQGKKLNRDNFKNNIRENLFYIRRSWNI